MLMLLCIEVIYSVDENLLVWRGWSIYCSDSIIQTAGMDSTSIQWHALYLWGVTYEHNSHDKSPTMTVVDTYPDAHIPFWLKCSRILILVQRFVIFTPLYIKGPITYANQRQYIIHYNTRSLIFFFSLTFSIYFWCIWLERAAALYSTDNSYLAVYVSWHHHVCLLLTCSCDVSSHPGVSIPRTDLTIQVWCVQCVSRCYQTGDHLVVTLCEIPFIVVYQNHSLVREGSKWLLIACLKAPDLFCSKLELSSHFFRRDNSGVIMPRWHCDLGEARLTFLLFTI